MDGVPEIPAKTIVQKTKSADAWFGVDYNMNIYRGCSHGCIYCDSRSDCYRNTDFDTVKVKKDALRIIRDDLRRKVKTGVVGSGAMSDPYNPLEHTQRLTRNSLELINAYTFGASLCTKSALIVRDSDVLNDISKHSPVIIKMSITAFDDELSKRLEPNVSVTSERLAALSELSKTGLFCGVLLVPVLPFITDTEDNIKMILQGAKDAGAKFVYSYMGMTLRQGNREYFYQQLDNLGMSEMKYKYQNRFDLRYSISSPKIKKLCSIYREECNRLGLLCSMKAIIHQYKADYEMGQLSLF